MEDGTINLSVLVVDDHDLVRNLVLSILESGGVTAIAAASGAEALERFDAERAHIGCVLLDLSMPGMNGPQVLAALRERDPELRVVLMTAHDEATADVLMPGVEPNGYLRKPFKPEKLIATVRELLPSP